MGDLRVCSPEPNGSFPSKPTAAIDALYWIEAEGATQEIIAQVQPTLVSEERRRVVIDYVQRLIRASLGCEVFPFGSVPLKTYLPDGDIDLTAFGGLNVEEALANDVYSILEKEDQNRGAEFVVRDVQLIRAEVKLVKCLVQNIVVDISFNQLGGLCTLCFLEKVDRLIAKDHLFKRSIILIKAWCYYESRILGAHHGLISTYALETLVLYIFHLFHSSLNGPLAVLYKFLDYFSKFDWENYCISLNGPVRVTSLPEIVAETPDNSGGDLLLSTDFLKDCVERFSSTSRGSEANSRIFLQKHLNIVDPLKENNNLGRSVSKGNFYRIRSAFTYGARKLGRILSQPEENLADEIRKFFSNTLDRHGSGQRPDVQDPLPVVRHNGSGPVLSFAATESCHVNQTIFESESAHSGFITMNGKVGHEESFQGDNNVKETDMRFSTTKGAPQNGSREVVCTANLLEDDLSGITISENRISGNAQDLATSKVKDPKPSSPSGVNTSSFAIAPHLYFSSSFVGNGEKRKETSDQNQAASSNVMKQVSSEFLQVPDDEAGITVSRDLDESHLVSNREALSPVGSNHCPLSSVPWSSKDLTPTGIVGTPESLSSLSDLNGDFENHIESLNYGRLWLDCALNTPVRPLMLSQFQRQISWETVPHSVQAMQSNRNVFPHANANGHVVPGTPYYPMNSLPIIPRAPFPIEEMPKQRGTGTYFPNANHYRDRPLAARGRNPTPVRSPRNNGRVGTHFEPNSQDRSSRDPSQAQFQDQQGVGKYGSSDNRELPLAQFHSQQAGGKYGPSDSREMSQASFHSHQGGGKYGSSDPRELSQALFHAQGAGKYVSSDSYQGSPKKKANPSANNPFSHQPEKMSVLPPFAAQLLSSEGRKQPNSGSEVAQNPSLNPSTPGMQALKPVLGAEETRIAVQSYKLKDEEDFPPLSF